MGLKTLSEKQKPYNEERVEWLAGNPTPGAIYRVWRRRSRTLRGSPLSYGRTRGERCKLLNSRRRSRTLRLIKAQFYSSDALGR